MKIYALAFILLLGLSTCKKKDCKCHDQTNPDCENFDPCFGKSPVTADFKIGQILSANIAPSADPYKGFVEDTIFPLNCSIKFKANTEGAKYTWYLGVETIETKEFARVFDDKLPIGKYTVTLIIEKAPDLACFPTDDGKDTLVKNFYLVKPCELKTAGTYKGVVDDEKDSIEWKITFVNMTMSWPPAVFTSFCGTRNIIITGLNRHIRQPDLKDTVITNNYFISNKEVFLDYVTNSIDEITYAHFNLNNPNAIDFTYKNEGSNHRFRGRKK